MYSPGFFKVSVKAMSARELIRRFGIWRFPLLFLVARFAHIQPFIHWMPQLWADLECDQQMLPEEFWPKTARHREAVEKLGFVCCGFSRLKNELSLNRLNLDNGKVTYIHKNNIHIALVLYHKTRIAEPVNKEKEEVVVAFTAAFPIGSLSCSNAKGGFEPNADEQVVRNYTDDVLVLYETFLNALKPKSAQPLTFSTTEQMKQLFDERLVKRFENRVKRGLFIKMTDLEIEQARRRIPPPLPKQGN
jgi:hypothetical protein